MSRCNPTIVMYEPVPEEIVTDVVEAVKRVYSVRCPGYVEIIFHASREGLDAGGVSVEYEPGFYYEAYEDIPRIHVVADDAAILPKPVRRAMAVHEAVHSILHPSREYYLAPVDNIIVYHAAYTTVKDLEVHLWMARHGFKPELYELRSYWDNTSLDCGLAEEIIDEARRITVYVALGEKPEERCGAITRRLYERLKELASCEPRPWYCRDKLVELFDILL